MKTVNKFRINATIPLIPIQPDISSFDMSNLFKKNCLCHLVRLVENKDEFNPVVDL